MCQRSRGGRCTNHSGMELTDLPSGIDVTLPLPFQKEQLNPKLGAKLLIGW